MAYTKPAEHEFKILKDGVRHVPTEAEWMAYGNGPLQVQRLSGMLGSQLDDGRDYRPAEVFEMARAIWSRELERRRAPV